MKTERKKTESEESLVRFGKATGNCTNGSGTEIGAEGFSRRNKKKRERSC